LGSAFSLSCYVMRDIEPKIDTYEENSLGILNFESTACLVEVEPWNSDRKDPVH